MPNDNNTTTSLGINVSQFKRGLQDATRQIKLANAEFKAAAAGMDKWSDSATGIQAKITQLEKVLDAENKKLAIQKQQLEEVEKTQGKNSAAADEMRIAIANQQASIAKTEKSLGYFNTKLADMGDAEKQAKTATGQLSTTINDQQGKLDALKKKYTEVVLAQGANSKEAKQLAAQITALSGDLQENKQKMTDAESAADKLDKSLTEVGDAAEEAGKDAESAGNGGFTVLKGVMANLATQAINAALGGIKKMGSALIGLGKDAIAAGAESEQLVGGVMKLFGAGGQGLYEYAENVGKSVDEVQEEYDRLMSGQSKVFENANNAYKTAGLSANEYMETVTGFSASLISSLGGDTEKAANLADIAITDMADNANTFGTSIGDIQNAYQGFAKGNYTMLDNLKLGYGGTKEEMLRLVKDAGVVEDSVKSIDDVSFDQIIEAINKTQERMGIAGATAKEAAGTIEGSANAMKASWKNLVSVLTLDDVDMEEQVGQFVDSLLTYLGNVVPLVEIVIRNIQTLITEFAQNGLPQIVEMIGNVLPGVIQSLTTLITSLVSELLPQLLDVISSELPNFLNAGAQLLITLITGIVSAIPQLTTAVLNAIGMIITTIAGAIPDIVNAFVTAYPLFVNAILDAVPMLLDAAVTLFTAFGDAIPQIIPYLTNELPKLIDKIVDTLNENIPIILDAAIELLNALVDAVPVVIDALVPALPKIIDSISNVLEKNLPVILNAAIQMFMSIVNAIPVIIKKLVPMLPKIIKSIVDALIKNIPTILKAAVQLLMAIVNAIPIIINAIVPEIPGIINTIVKLLIDNIPVLLDAAIQFLMAIVDALPIIIQTLVPLLPDIVNTIVQVLIENIPILLEAAFTMFMAIVDAIPDFIVELISGLGTILTTIIDTLITPVKEFFGGLWEDIQEIFSGIGQWFGEKFGEAWEKIKEPFNAVGKFFSGVWNSITKVFTDGPRWFYRKFLNVLAKIKEPMNKVGGFFSDVWGGIKDVFSGVGKWFGDIFGGVKDIILAPLNAIIDGLNVMIGGLNKISFDIPGWVPGLGGKSFGFDIPKIPNLQQGGVLARGQVGLLEGNGAEAVVPLDQNKKWINATARDLKQALEVQGVIGKGGPNVTNYNFTQNNTSPKPLNRLEIYRQTKNIINYSAGVN